MKQLLTMVALTLSVTAFAQKPNMDKAIAALNKGQLVEARMIIDKAIDRQKTKDYDYYYNKGVENYQAEDYAAAADNFEKAHSILPDDGLSILNAAYASLQMEDHERAKMNFKKASENGVAHLSVFLKPLNCEPLAPIGISTIDSEIALSVVPKSIYSNAQSRR